MERKKIVLVGPVYPYKGGIAHYTSLLYRTLAQKHDVVMISYKMQYPKLLFKKEQRDYSNDMFKVEDTQFLINTTNPFNIMAVGKKIRKQNPDLVILQWWHPYFAPCYWLLAKAIGKKIKKIYTCHNVFPHERFPLDKWLTKLALKRGDAYIVHSQSDAEELKAVKKNAVYRLNPHPTYNAFKIKNLSRMQAREALHKGEQEKLLLFFGFVREYKGLKHLLKAMPEIKAKLGNVKLMVVGSFGEDKANYLQLIREGQIEDCVEVIDGYTPDDEVEKYFAACDLVVLPYESATQSGIVQIAFGFELPVIVTNVGGLPDVVEDGKMGYIVPTKDPGAIAKAVIDFYRNDKAAFYQENVRKEAFRFDWERMREAVEGLMRNNNDSRVYSKDLNI